MKSKKTILFLIIFFPSVFWLVLELSTINTKKMPHYGPKQLNGSDTVFYKTGSVFKTTTNQQVAIDTVTAPLYLVCFIKKSYKTDNYRLAGLAEYAQYKREKIKHIPFYIISVCDSTGCFDEFKKLAIGNNTIYNLHWNNASFDSLNNSYFKLKPYFVDYSFFVLVDKNRNIRGYYDGRYVAEIKRLIDEYQHLRLKEEKKTLLNKNKIEAH